VALVLVTSMGLLVTFKVTEMDCVTPLAVKFTVPLYVPGPSVRGFTPIETGVGVVPEVGVTTSQDPPLVVTVYATAAPVLPGVTEAAAGGVVPIWYAKGIGVVFKFSSGLLETVIVTGIFWGEPE
jgi:hypothetical protein